MNHARAAVQQVQAVHHRPGQARLDQRATSPLGIDVDVPASCIWILGGEFDPPRSFGSPPCGPAAVANLHIPTGVVILPKERRDQYVRQHALVDGDEIRRVGREMEDRQARRACCKRRAGHWTRRRTLLAEAIGGGDPIPVGPVDWCCEVVEVVSEIELIVDEDVGPSDCRGAVHAVGLDDREVGLLPAQDGHPVAVDGRQVGRRWRRCVGYGDFEHGDCGQCCGGLANEVDLQHPVDDFDRVYNAQICPFAYVVLNMEKRDQEHAFGIDICSATTGIVELVFAEIEHQPVNAWLHGEVVVEEIAVAGQAEEDFAVQGLDGVGATVASRDTTHITATAGPISCIRLEALAIVRHECRSAAVETLFVLRGGR